MRAPGNDRPRDVKAGDGWPFRIFAKEFLDDRLQPRVVSAGELLLGYERARPGGSTHKREPGGGGADVAREQHHGFVLRIVWICSIERSLGAITPTDPA